MVTARPAGTTSRSRPPPELLDVDPNADPPLDRQRGQITGYRVGARLIRLDLNEIEAKLVQVIPSAATTPADQLSARRRAR